MPSATYITDADGTNYYLSGTSGSYTGSGTPWTAQSTSPYELSLNDATPPWTPQAPQPLDVYNGGPPFRVGADLAFRGYPNVTEQVGVQMRASSHDNAVVLLRNLRRALSATLTSRPPILVVQPDGATNAVYYEVLSAHVQETTAFINEEAGRGILRAVITWTRSPFGGKVSSGETLINAVTVNNTGTGSPDNVESLGTSGTGDLIREGGPLNVRVTLPSAVSRELLIGTVASRTYTNRNDSLVTSSTAGTGIVTITSALDLTTLITTRGLRVRVLFRITNASTTLQVRAGLVANTGYAYTYPSGWQTATTSGGSNVLLDMGGLGFSQLWRAFATGTMTLSVAVEARSTTGAATTGVLDYIEAILYYSWAQVSRFEDTGTVSIETFTERANLPALPLPPRAFTLSSSNYSATEQIRGKPPIYLPSASLYLAWREPTTNAHSTSESATLTATHAPLYHTLRGGG